MHVTTRRTCGFTLLEMTIVVAILGLVAAVAIPQLTANRQEDRADSLVDRLASLRQSIDQYWVEHDGYPGPTPVDFTRQLLGQTDRSGRCGQGEAFALGPYLAGELPSNPITESREVSIVDAMPDAPRGDSAWIYCNVTGEIRSNATGRTLDGVAFFDL